MKNPEIKINLTEKIKAKLLEEEGFEEVVSEESWAAEKNKGKKLNKPFRTPGGPKKFSVYVKNKNGNVVKVNFGDPNMEIKRDDPERRKSFRARHNCSEKKDKTKAGYWSCKMWSQKSVTKVTKGSDFELEEALLEYLDESEAKKKSNLFDNIRKKKKRMGKNYKPAKTVKEGRPTKKAWKKATANPDVEKHYFKTKEEAIKDAKKLGLDGYHTHQTEDGNTLYMAGPDHETFMKKHKELTKARYKNMKKWKK